MTRIVGPTGSRRRRRFLLVPSLCIAALALFYVGSAQAVHDLQFQLDGDVSTTCWNPNPPPTTCASPSNDWGANADNSSPTQASPNSNGIFDVKNTANGSARPDGTTCALAAGCQDVVPNPNLVPGTFTNASFQRDFESGPSCSLFSQSTTFCTADDSTYATGSKDTLGIGNGGWQCNHDNNVNSKIDIMNGYVATYTNPANGHLIEYFGMEKNKNNGTNDVGVWFLKGNASCSAPSGHINFTGAHQDGDTLVVSEFTQGGGVSTIKVFAWAAAASGPLSGDGGCIDSHDNPNPSGGCDGKPIFQSTNQDCKGPLGGGDPVCATTNATGSPPYNQNVTTPWLTADATLGVGHTVVPPDFYEGGIDITATFGQAGQNAPRCFTTAVPDTRSSASITATLFDYVINTIGSCTGSISTKAGDTAHGGSAPPTTIGGGSVDSGTDVAALTISGTPTWGGAVDFYLCGPLTPPGGTGPQCNKATALLVTHRAASGSGATPVSVVSGSATLTKVGTYCWAAHFEPDAATKAAGLSGFDDKVGSGDNSANECFTVAPNTPSLATAAVDCTSHAASGSVTFGTPVCDKGTLSNAATQPATSGIDTNYNSIICKGDADGPSDPAIPAGAIACTAAGSSNGAAPGGSITFKLLGPNDCLTTAAGTPAANNPETVNVTSGNGDYFTSGFTTASVGAFHWTASYTPATGDVNNTSTSHNTACDDTGEDVTVTGTASSASDQRWLPNDRVTITSTAPLSGTLDVTLYKGTSTTDVPGNCVPANGAVQEYQSLGNSISGASPQTFNTGNTAFYVGSGPAVIGGVTVTYGAPGAYFWLIHYHDNNLSSPLDRCESSNVTITN